jgi:hypothetical protein
MALVSVRPSLIGLLGVAGAAWSTGCGESPPVPVVTEVSPARAYTDLRHRMTITGDNFIPRYTVDPAAGLRLGDARGFSARIGSGGRWTALRALGWRSEKELSAWLEPALLPGSYDIEVSDPRGMRAIARQSFEALGPDRDPPTIDFESPARDTPIVAGIMLSGRFVARDRPPGRLHSVRWEVRAGELIAQSGDCPLEPDASTVICRFTAVVPSFLAENAPFELVGRASDGPVASAIESSVRFLVHGRPTLGSITPPLGGVDGGTEVLIRGTGFVRGTRILVDEIPLLPGGGVVVDETTITGRIPDSRGSARRADVKLDGPIGTDTLPAAFEYRNPPAIESVSPEAGDPEGGTPVRIRGFRFDGETRIYFGIALADAVALVDLKLESDTEISGTTPPGKGRTSVWAFDRRLGFRALVGGFGWGSR